MLNGRAERVLDLVPPSNASIAWNSSSAIASRRLRSVASCAGSAKTSSASRATSLLVRAAGNDSDEARSRLEAHLGPERARADRVSQARTRSGLASAVRSARA